MNILSALVAPARKFHHRLGYSPITLMEEPFVSIIEQHGGTHTAADVDEVVIDLNDKVVTTPCYMLATKVSEANAGIRKLVQKYSEFF